MVTGLQTSASAMEAQSERLAVLANNLANISAGGFKAEAMEFFQSLSSPRAAGPVSPAGSAAPLSPPAPRVRTNFAQGPLVETNNPLDVAIDGPGFFVVRTAAGPRLTRAGSFTRAADGSLTTADGSPVLDDRQRPLRLPDSGRIVMDDTGQITVDGNPAGKLLIVTPPRLDQLDKDGGTRFVPPADLPLTPASQVRVRQGALEQSNVNPVLTLVEMIDALRVYEAAQRAARGLDETLGRAVNDVGRP